MNSAQSSSPADTVAPAGNSDRGPDAPAAAPEGALIATLSRHLVIRASAGSGKTYQLAIRYLGKLLDGVPPERILASTFTRKAAGEILARILVRLATAARDSKELRELAVHLGRPTLDRDQCLQLLKQLAGSLHRMRVGTLDSFFARLATSYTLELGLPPGWTILDELDDARLRRQAIEQVLSGESTTEIRRLTNLISRGDATRRVSALIHDKVNSLYNVFRTTDRDAWHRTPEVALLPAETLQATIEELRLVELPDHKTVQKRRTKDWEAAARHDWESFIGQGIGAKIAQGETKFSGRELAPAAIAIYQRLLDHGCGCQIQQLTSRTAALYEILAAFDKVYRKLKLRARGQRFEDVTERLAEALGDEAESAGIMSQLAYRLDSETAHLLLDEFQDTSLTQWQVMQPLAENITNAPEGTSFFVVGDVKQAIYGWRGGVAEIFDAIDRQLAGVETAPLASSFRSSQAVINTVNKVFENLNCHPNLDQDEQTIRSWCAAVEPHTTEKKEHAGYATLETCPIPPERERIETVIACAAERVRQVYEQTTDQSIGVLVRQNKNIAPLVAELKARGLDVSEESSNPLTDSAAVIILLSLLQMADHPGDTVARFHVATSPLGAALDFPRHDDDARAVALSDDIRRQLVDDGYGPTLEVWARMLIPSCGRRDITRLGQLVELGYRSPTGDSLRPTDFVRFVESERVQDPSSSRIRVMSVHQAKGLQFDAVVLPLLDHSLIAGAPDFVVGGASATSPPDLVSVYANATLQPLLPPEFQAAFDETRASSVRGELCVLYVALTRAIHALHLVIPPTTGTEAKLPRNSSGLLRAALADGQRASPSSLLYEHGDPDWPTHNEKASAATSAAGSGSSAARVAPPVVRLAAMVEGRSRGLGRVAPSQSTTPQRVRISQLAEPTESAALSRGTLIHAWFEQIEWLDAGPPDEQQLRAIARRKGFDEAETTRHLTSFRAMLERPAVAALLGQDTYTSLAEPPLSAPVCDQLAAGGVTLDVSRERAVAVRLEGDLLIGTIDRLVLLRQAGQVIAADIIDYKTDAIGHADAADLDRTAHYRRQLESYAAAIARIYRLPPHCIAARLLFVETGQLVTV